MRATKLSGAFRATLAASVWVSIGLAAPHIPETQIPKEAQGKVAYYIKELYSMNPTIRGSAAERLGSQGDAAAPAVPFLAAMLDDDERLRWQATLAEDPLEPPAHRREREERTTPGREAAKALSRVGKSGIGVLLRVVTDPDAVYLKDPAYRAIPERERALKRAHARQNAALALGGLKDPRAVPALLPLLHAEVSLFLSLPLPFQPLIPPPDPEEKKIRIEVAGALGRLGDRRAVAHLIGALHDPSWEVRRETAWALGQIRDPMAMLPLMARLDDIEAVRLEVERALLEIRSPAAVEPAIAKLKDKELTVRLIAARLLGKLLDRRAVPALIATLSDEAPDVKFEAQVALRALSKEHYSPNPAQWQRWWDMEQADADLKPPPDQAVETCLAALKAESWAVRAAAARRLGGLGDYRAVEPLLAALTDKDETVRRYAAKALGELADARAAEGLIAALQDDKPEVQIEAHTALRVLAEQDLGGDPERWKEWWQQRKEALLTKAREKEEEAARDKPPEPVRATPRARPAGRDGSGAGLLLILALAVACPLGILILIRLARRR